MSLSCQDVLLSQFGNYLTEQMGLHFPPKRATDLQRGIEAATREFGFKDANSCMQWLMSAPLSKKQIEILASSLTVGETYFLREKRSFEVLEEQVLPELIRMRHGGEQRLRLWSAACCSGEEPYSMAISLQKQLPELARSKWNVTLLGSDINPLFLQKASKGLFGDWSFRGTLPTFRECYFREAGAGRWEILPEIRKMVSFFYLNLVEDAYPSLLNNTNALDIIFCRNVLIYFEAAQALKVIQQLSNCLVEGGWLVLGPNEITELSLPGLHPVRFPGTTFYQKDSSRWRSISPAFPQPITEPVSLLAMPLELVVEPDIVAPLEKFVVSEPITPEVVSPIAPYEQALVFYEHGRYAETAELLEELSSQETGDSRVPALLARALANQGKIAEALSWCDKAIASNKLNIEGHYLRASISQELGNLDEAASALSRTLYLDPDFVLAHFALGNLTRSQGKLVQASKHFDNALTLARRRPPEDILPEGDGLTAGRLCEIIISSGLIDDE